MSARRWELKDLMLMVVMGVVFGFVYWALVFTLLVVTVRRGERMAQALESRGLGLTPRTTWRPVRVERADWWLAVGVLATVAVVLALTAAAGVLRGPGALT